jgi:hypothetical protein
MKRLAILAFAHIAALAALAQTPAVPGIHTVYVMPMSGGLDQHLADHITRDHVYQVVTDPRIADAFLTDRIGSAFEQRLAEWFPPAAGDKNAPLAGRGGLKSVGSRGTVFLVEAKSRQVVWSDFESPGDASPKAMSREAERITKKLAGTTAK